MDISAQNNKVSQRKTQLFGFIVVLRLIATCLITNTHYNNIYPISALAVGGLLGDVLFFMVSGFCYGEGTRDKNFIIWYLKRIIRIYPAILIMSFVNCIGGLWDYSAKGFFRYFIFPTNFIFFASIMVIYIPIYFLGKVKQKKLITAITVSTFLCWLIVFCLFMKKDTFFMQATENISCQFLYMMAALIGICFRRFVNINKIKKQKTTFIITLSATIIFAVGYLLTTVLIRYNAKLYDFQIITQIFVLLTISCLFFFFMQSEKYVNKLPNSVFKAIKFLADMTLEIYAVQRIIIYYLEDIVFPLNWVVVTALIIALAFVLKVLCNKILSVLNKGLLKLQTVFGR